MFQGRVLRVNVANVKKGDYKKMGVCLLDGIMRSSPCPHLQGREVFGQKVGGGEQHSVLERSLSKQRHRHEGDLGEARRENERYPRCGVWKHGCASRSGGNRGVRRHQKVAGIPARADRSSRSTLFFHLLIEF